MDGQMNGCIGRTCSPIDTPYFAALFMTVLVYNAAGPKEPHSVQYVQETTYHFITLYITLTEFSVCTKYGPSFFSLIYGPSEKLAGHKSTGKKLRSVTYSMDQENKVSKIFIIYLRLIQCAAKKTSRPY